MRHARGTAGVHARGKGARPASGRASRPRRDRPPPTRRAGPRPRPRCRCPAPSGRARCAGRSRGPRPGRTPRRRVPRPPGPRQGPSGRWNSSSGPLIATPPAPVGQHGRLLADRADLVDVQVRHQQLRSAPSEARTVPSGPTTRLCPMPVGASGPRQGVPGSAWPTAATQTVASSARARTSSSHWSSLPGPAPQEAASRVRHRPGVGVRPEQLGEADVVAGGQAERGRRRRRSWRGGSPGRRSRTRRKPKASYRWILSYDSSTPGPVASRVLATRPSSAGVNMPATTTVPAARAISRTPSAHGPSRGSASGASGCRSRPSTPPGRRRRGLRRPRRDASTPRRGAGSCRGRGRW